MRYRIEVSKTRKGAALVSFPGRVVSLEANEHDGPIWQVSVTDLFGSAHGTVAVRAEHASDAVWRVAQAAVRAVAELTDSPIEGDIKPSRDNDLLSNAR